MTPFANQRKHAEASARGTAIIAHECGHQLLARHPSLRLMRKAGLVIASEEILASLLGSIIVKSDIDRDMLYAKAVVEAMKRGIASDSAMEHLERILKILREML